MEYSFYQRLKETDITNVSAASEALLVATDASDVEVTSTAIPLVARCHVQNVGNVVGEPSGKGVTVGTTGQSKRLEAVRIGLTGDAAKQGNYSVWYRAHSQDCGWLGWAHDGAEAGTSGLSKRAEAIDMQVLPQGQVSRGYDASQAACVTA